MKKLAIRKVLLLAGVAVFAFLMMAILGGRQSVGGSQYMLSAPSFVQVAEAAVENEALDAIQNEAGISAYFKANTTVTISSVRNEFQTIEIETADYILGTISLSGYPEDHAPHVYVHSDGWFMAYYLNADPVAKIIDLDAYIASNYTTISTKLENVLTTVAGAAGVGITTISHYDFRYPNATTMMFIAERAGGSGDNYFTINIPSSFGVAERSASIYGPPGWNHGVTLNGENVVTGGTYQYASIAASKMPPDTTHTITVFSQSTSVGMLALVYTE